jgi:hypothetical protein
MSFLESSGQPGVLLLECLGLLLGGFFSLGAGPAWIGPAGFTFALLIALWAWWRTFTRSRLISGTPAERIASSAQGYSRLSGRGKPLGGQQIYLPGVGVPCLWYRATIVPESDTPFQIFRGVEWIFGSAELPEHSESDGSFLIDDGSGAVCAVDPEGAEILGARYRTNTAGSRNGQSWYLLPGDKIYVLGEFFTLGSIDADLNTSRRIGELLEFWKTDRPELLRRFDQNGDGELSLQEWEQARAAAREEVEREQREALATPEAHLMRKPRDGRPYLIADSSLGAYARQLWWWSIAHGLVFVLAAAALAWFQAHDELPAALQKFMPAMHRPSSPAHE